MAKEKMVTIKARKWGNSIGFVVPKEVVEELHIKLDDMITVNFKPKNPLQELWNANLGITQNDLQAVRKEFKESKYYD